MFYTEFLLLMYFYLSNLRPTQGRIIEHPRLQNIFQHMSRSSYQ